MSVINFFGANLRPEWAKGIFFIRSVVPNPDLESTYAAEWRTSVNAYVGSTRTTEKYVCRGMTYVLDTYVTDSTYAAVE